MPQRGSDGLGIVIGTFCAIIFVIGLLLKAIKATGIDKAKYGSEGYFLGILFIGIAFFAIKYIWDHAGK